VGIGEGAFENGAQLDDLMPRLITSFQEGKLVSPQAFEQGSDAEGRPLVYLGEGLASREHDASKDGDGGGKDAMKINTLENGQERTESRCSHEKRRHKYGA
jgi:hypothetical protein